MRSAAILTSIVLVTLPAAARAGGNSGAADPVLEFGAITTYPSEDQARASCGRDIVVWADRHAGYFFFKREQQYGTTSEGAFACKNNVENANYWSSGPMGGMAKGHGSGRVFPERFPSPTS